MLIFFGLSSWLILVLNPKLLWNMHFGGPWIYPELGSEVCFHCRLISHKYIDVYFWFKKKIQAFVYLEIVSLDNCQCQRLFCLNSRWQPLFWWYSDHEEQKNMSSGKYSRVSAILFMLRKKRTSIGNILGHLWYPCQVLWSFLLLRFSLIHHTWALGLL